MAWWTRTTATPQPTTPVPWMPPAAPAQWMPTPPPRGLPTPVPAQVSVAPQDPWVFVGHWRTTDNGFARQLADAYGLSAAERTPTRGDAPMQIVATDPCAYLYVVHGDRWLAVSTGPRGGLRWSVYAGRGNQRTSLPERPGG